MKKTVAFIIALALIACFSVSYAADEYIPENVQAYAETVGVPFAKGVIESNRSMGVALESIGNVEALTLGSGFRIMDFSVLKGKSIRESLKSTNTWVYSLDNANGPAVLFNVFMDDSGNLFKSGVDLADHFTAAMDIMHRLAEKAGVKDEPVVLKPFLNYVLYLSFNGDERVLPVPTDAFEFDKEYLAVTDYTQLPTAGELINKLLEEAELNENVTDPLEAVGSGIIELPAHPDAAAVKQASKVSPLWYVIPAAIVVIAAAAVIIKRRAKKA